jgi:hypothetical protein
MLRQELKPVFARMAAKEKEEAEAYKHLPRVPPTSDVVVLSPEETAKALAAAEAAAAELKPSLSKPPSP